VERRELLLAALLGFVGCRPPVARYPLPPVINLYVVVSAQVAREDSGNVSALVETLEAEMRDAGHQVNIVPARDDEGPPAARVELRVLTSEAADQELMAGAQLGNIVGAPAGVGVFAHGGGGIVVDAYFVPGNRQRASYLGRFEAGTLFAMAEDAQTVAGERAGESIARQLFKYHYDE
jgi:hypothetical protein